jgi:dUTP pyrophosphatase
MTASVKFTKLSPYAKIPSRGSEYAAGYDLHACFGDTELQYMEIQPHMTVKVGTGLAIQPPHGYFGAIFARSGLATKQGLRPSNCVGICDEDYTGEYIVALHNDTDCVQRIHHGDRIAQLVFMPYLDVEFEEVESLDETARGSGGFGSTGKA